MRETQPQANRIAEQLSHLDRFLQAGSGLLLIRVIQYNTATLVKSLLIALTLLPGLAAQVTITSTSPLTGGVATVAYSYTLTASGGVTPYTWTVISGALPGGFNLASNGVISGMANTATVANFTIEVADSSSPQLTASMSFTLAVAPEITNSSLPASTINEAYPNTHLNANGLSGSPTWSASNLPSGLTITPGGLLGGTPAVSGAFTPTFSVMDPSGAIGAANIALTINAAPVITTSGLPATTINEAYPNTQLNASGGTGTLTWSASNLPNGLTISQSGLLGGTPTVSGAFTPTFSVKDPGGAMGTANIPLTINAAPTITDSSPLPSGDVAVQYNYQFGSSPVSGGTPGYTWSSQSTLPPGLSLSSSGLLAGTPTTTGLFTFTIAVTDSTSASGSKKFALIVGTLPVQVTVGPAPPASTVGVRYPPSPPANQPPYFQASRGTGTGYTWAATGLPPGISISPIAPSDAGLSGTPTTAGSFNGTATATDSANENGSVNFTLVINAAPVINTGTLQACTAGTFCSRTLSLTGGTSPFTWGLASGSLPTGISLSAAGVISGTPSTAATASFGVTVTDSATASNTQLFSLTVNPAITFTPASLPATSSGTAYSQNFTPSGGTGAITFTAANLPSWLTLSGAGQLSGTAPAVSSPTSYPFTVKATDANNATATNAYTVTVNPVPIITTTSPLPSWTVNRPYSQNITAVGGTGAITFTDNGSTLPGWLTISAAGLLSGTPPATGSFSFTLRVTDAAGAFSTAAFGLTINPAPAVTTTTLPSTTSGQSYNQTLGETGGTTPFTWQGSNVPGWLTLSAAGVLSGTAPVETNSTPFTFSVTVSDTSGSVSAPQSLTVIVNPGIQITTGSPLPATESGLNYSQAFASTGGTGAITWSGANLPSWLALPASGVLAGAAPSVAAPTTYNFNVTATDTVGATGSKAFSITVNPLVTIATAQTLPAWTVNQPYSQTITAIGGIPGYTFTDAGTTLPAWLAISGSGLLAGTPPATGTFSFTLKVTDSAGGVNTKTFSLTIDATPSVTTTSLPATTSGLVYSQVLAATAGTGAFTFGAAGLPSWLALSGATLSGTAPTVQSATPYNFSVTATDSTGAVSPSQPLSVTVNPPVTITTINPLPSAGSGTAYSQTFTATGGTGAITWTFGNRPSWLTQNGSLLSGTAPTVAQATNYSFTATATDSLGATSGAQPFTVTVSSGVIITTSQTLGPWTATRPYSVTLQASGGTPPYIFADAGQTLPTWLTLNGAVLSGTPPSAGSFPFTIKVTDNLGSSSTKNFTLTVNAVPAVSTTTLPATTSGLPYSQPLTASGGTPPLAWSATGLPSWLTLNGATLVGTAPAVQSPTPYSFSVTATDSTGAVSPSQLLSVTVNPPVVITTTNPLPAAGSGTAYSQTFAASGGTGAITWMFANRPTWLTQNGALLNGTAPTVQQATTYNFTATATDSLGATSGPQPFGITVSSGVIITTGQTLGPWTATRPYSVTLQASGGTPPYTFADAGQTLPTWLTLNGAVLGGTPPSAGAFSFTIKVTDSLGSSSSKNFTLTVNAVPAISTTTLPATTSGLPYSQPLAASGGTPPLAWSATGLPSWLTLNGATLAGTAPAVQSPTPYNFSVAATDSTGAVSPSQLLSVTVNPPVVITTTNPLPSAGSGAAYSQTFASSGGTGAITWTFGNRPPWLTQNGALLSGTAPTVQQATTYNFTATATDSLGATSGAQPFGVTVSLGVIITTSQTLGPWTATRPYSVTLQASGGTAPYTFADAGQTLPSWLALSGAVLSGTPPSAGSFPFTIKVTDSLGSSSTKAFTLTINAVPAVTTTTLPATTSGLSYSQPLAASGGTPPLAWSATGLPSWLTLNGATLVGTAPAVQSPTPYNFSVAATDSTGAVSPSQSLSVTVNPPVVITTTNPLPSAGSGAAYSQTFTSSGGTGAITWTFGNRPPWLTQNGALLSGTAPTVQQATTYNFTATATDLLGATSGPQAFSVTVSLGVIITTTQTLGPWTATRPYSVTLQASGGTAPYTFADAGQTLPTWLALNGAVLSGTPPSAGSFPFTIKVTDSLGSSNSKSFVLTINAVPAVTTTTLPATTSGLSYSQPLNASGGTPPLSWNSAGLPTWLSLNGATLSGTAPTVQSATPYNFSVTATDSTGAVSPSQILSVTVNPPVIITTINPLPSAGSGAAYSQTFTSSGGTGAITWTFGNRPTWLSQNGALLSGTSPTVSQATTYNFTATATDSLGATSGAQPFSVTVSSGVIITTSAALGPWTATRPYSVTLQASGGTAPYTFADAGQTLPTWLALNGGVLSGTPPSAGSFPFTIKVTDSLGNSSTKSFTLTVNAVPAVTTTTLPATTSGLPYSQSLTASGGTPPLSWNSAGLPTWLSLNGATLVGTAPTVQSATPYNFSVTVTDSAVATSSQQLSVTVNPGVTITTAPPLATATPAVAYGVTFAASGGTGVITWSATNLPSWLSLSGSVLSGIPPANSAGTTVNFTIRATDSVGAFATGDFSIKVASTSPPPGGGTLPSWTVNQPYSAALTLATGTPPYKNWTVSTGALPAGLQLNAGSGVISGTPSAPGTSSFTVTATDSNSLSIPSTWKLTINSQPAITTQNLPAGSVGVAYSEQLTNSGGTAPFTWTAQNFNGFGLQLASSGVLGGVPGASGTLKFAATVTDAAGAVAQLPLTLTLEPAFTISNGPLPQTTSTASYSQTIAATGGSGSATFSAPLPNWLSLTATGSLTGVAPVVTLRTEYDFIVTATDSLGAVATKQMAVVVNPAPRVVTATLPAGTQGAAYTAQLEAGGGTGALTWSDQSLPAWAKLSASGVISGTPPASATVAIQVSVTDSLGVASQPTSIALEIDPPAGTPRITTACPFPATTAGLNFSVALTADQGYPPYSWSATGRPSWLLLSSGGQLTGTAAAGAYDFTIQVADSHAQNASTQCGLTVNPAPVITATSLAPATVGAPYAQPLSASGGTGPLTWSANSIPGWLTIDPLTGLLRGSPAAPGNYMLTLAVTDTLGAVSAPASFTLTVANPGGAPVITACPLPRGSVGTPMAFQLTAALGFPPYNWSVSGLPAGIAVTGAGAVSGTPSVAGPATVQLSVTDSSNVTASQTCAMSIAGTPTVTTTTLPNGTVGAFYWQRLTSSGGVGAVEWSLAGGPGWLTLDPISGTLSGTPDAAGVNSFTVQVTDSQGTQSSATPLTITVAPAPSTNGIAITTACPLAPITQGMLLYDVFAATGGNPPYSWTAAGLPSGIVLDSSGVLLATPASGTLSFSVQATDQQLQQSSALACSVQINPAPAISTISLPDGVGGALYSAKLTATGGSGALSWSAAGPYWLNIDPFTGLLSGTPPLTGPVSVAVTVSDAYGISTSKTYSFQIAAPATGGLPALSASCPLPGATAGVSYSDTLSAAGGTPPYQFVVSPPIPGLTFGSSGAISGTPLTGGSTLLQVEVIDSAGNRATTPCGLTVTASGLSIAFNTPAGKVNQAYTGAFSASGGAAPFTWTIDSGTLPPGVTLNPSTGALTGTPSSPGTYTFSAGVKDSSGNTASAGDSITISPPLLITTAPSLPDASGGSGYQQTLSTSGASGTVTWSLASGALPPGVTLSSAGVISGSPTQGGTFTFTVQAADSTGQTAQLSFTLKVDLAPIPPVTITGLTSAVTPGEQITAAVSLGTPYPLDITGQLTITDTADPSIGLTDPAVQFAGGDASTAFRIPANSTQAIFATSPMFQTGTLAGTLALNVTLETGGEAVQPPSNPAISGQIAKLPPVIVGTPTVTQSAGEIQIKIVAFSTSRDMTSASFQFAGGDVQPSNLTVSLTSLVGAWYSSTQSDAYGSMFQLVQPFTTTGSSSGITGVTITLTNSVGNSTPVTVPF